MDPKTRLGSYERDTSQRGSHNRQKAKSQLARQHARIADIRHDELHKLTTDLASDYGVVVIENLNVKGMMSNRHLARAVGDMGVGEFRRQMEYKMPLHGGTLMNCKPVVSVEQVVLCMWTQARAVAAAGTVVDMPTLRSTPRPGPKRSHEFDAISRELHGDCLT